MFYLLCLALCLAVMFLVLAGTSLLFVPIAGLLETRLQQAGARTAANVLLILRLLPVSLAAGVSLGLALPAFLEFEPPSTTEMVSAPLIVLAVLGCSVLGLMLIRGVRMWRMTRFMQHEWQKHAQPVSALTTGVPLYRIDLNVSLLAVTGIFRPRVFVSRAVAEALTPAELSAALSHEIAHVRSYDNLKQVLMKLAAPPVWFSALRSTNEAWTRASEMAADEEALAQGASALELSSALIKVGRLSMGHTVPESFTGSHLVPCGCSSATLVRAAHLRDLLESETVVTSVHTSGVPRIVTALLVIALFYVGCLVTLLPSIHEGLEFLVR
jgi:Zn-dependent protease with chaperone function